MCAHTRTYIHVQCNVSPRFHGPKPGGRGCMEGCGSLWRMCPSSVSVPSFLCRSAIATSKDPSAPAEKETKQQEPSMEGLFQRTTGPQQKGGRGGGGGDCSVLLFRLADCCTQPILWLPSLGSFEGYRTLLEAVELALWGTPQQHDRVAQPQSS